MFEVENKFMVCRQGENVAIIKHPYAMKKSDALNLAAWLVALADEKNEFDNLLEAVKNA